MNIEERADGAEAAPARCLFLLLNSFAPIDVSNVTAVLYAANRHSDRSLFEWVLTSESGQDMTAPNGLRIGVDSDLPEVSHRDLVFVFGGDGYEKDASEKIIAWLRKTRRLGAKLVSIGGAIGTFAKAGMLDGRTASVHWMYRAALEDAFPSIDVVPTIFTMDMNVITCAGGAATLDMMLELITRQHGHDLAIGVADRLVCSASRTGNYDQTVSEQRRAGIRHEKLSLALQLIQQNIDDPLSPSTIAERIGISTRQLERLFSKYLRSTPKTYYMKHRLERARALLQQTNMKVIDVAMACGFTNQSHFSKVYRRHFGQSPHIERGVGSSHV